MHFGCFSPQVCAKDVKIDETIQKALLHASGCLRHITGCCTSSEEVQSKPRVGAGVSTDEFRHLGAADSHTAGSRYKKMNQISAVAHQAVPSGPNPLHN
ncbi:hypothetical protein RchiOBHm_Chr1g0377041 [Rosa chinensis]|uniref:Uncharacterized protein n=1 Tax=Rosa chinensis TaxID=74649 RepID=A0A2P6SMZ6_ROSCH|nr:hypothetical protein RchiOBHm_Chr1g0377041 [Rosa chinensis]